MKITRHICPRNCFDSCSILAYSQKGVLERVEGDRAQSYTGGRLCAKGYAYVNSTYSSERIIQPMRQKGNGSGRWEKITWDEALTQICEKILTIKEKYGSLLPLAFVKGSGNLGALHGAFEGLWNATGYCTKTVGSLCWAAGNDAHIQSFGEQVLNPDPEILPETDAVILWGVNPAWTATHSATLLQKLKAKGGRVVVVDIFQTATANLADLFIELRPGGDSFLALGILKLLDQEGFFEVRPELVKDSFGGAELLARLKKYTLDFFLRGAGVAAKEMHELAKIITTQERLLVWPGLGLQRHTYGGESIQAIHTLVAMSGKLGVNRGVLYPQAQFLSQNSGRIKSFAPPAGSVGLNGQPAHRLIEISSLARRLAEAQPPVEMIFVANANPLARTGDAARLREVMHQTGLVVTVDQFLTATGRESDLILPAAGFFESWDLNVSYWHRWVGVNQQSIAPVGESRSDLQIAWSLAAKLNQLNPGSCNFPETGIEVEWAKREFSPWLSEHLGGASFEDLFHGPQKLTNLETDFTPQNKIAIRDQDVLRGLHLAQAPAGYPYRFVTPHSFGTLNSQFQDLEWLKEADSEGYLMIHPETALATGVKNKGTAVIYNPYGRARLPVQVTTRVQPKLLVCYSGRGLDREPINTLIGPGETNMGRSKTGSPGVAFHDTFVNIVPGSEGYDSARLSD